jgi:hypothetical protein
MPYAVDFNEVSEVGLESSPVATALAGLRAHEARYYKNKYDHVFTVVPASEAAATIEWVQEILARERDIVMYTIDGAKKRAVGFKLSEGMEIPEELAPRFKFARQKSKLAGTIRGSYFSFQTDY